MAIQRETLEKIISARRQPGLAINPGTPVRTVEPFVDLLGIIMVMTVQAGFGGQRFMADEAPRIADAKRLLGGRQGTAVHVDGGISSETASVVGSYGVDVCVVGSALFQRGHDTQLEVEAVRRNASAPATSSAAR
jgi:ribulose-phosphate 3-epimerase